MGRNSPSAATDTSTRVWVVSPNVKARGEVEARQRRRKGEGGREKRKVMCCYAYA